MNRNARRHQRQSLKRVQSIGKRLARLARRDPERFKQEWNHRVNCWLGQIRYHARSLRDKDLSRNSHGCIFTVLEVVERLMTTMPRIEGFNKEEERKMFQYECTKALATALDPKLCKLVKNYSSKYLVS